MASFEGSSGFSVNLSEFLSKTETEIAESLHATTEFEFSSETEVELPAGRWASQPIESMLFDIYHISS